MLMAAPLLLPERPQFGDVNVSVSVNLFKQLIYYDYYIITTAGRRRKGVEERVGEIVRLTLAHPRPYPPLVRLAWSRIRFKKTSDLYQHLSGVALRLSVTRPCTTYP